MRSSVNFSGCTVWLTPPLLVIQRETAKRPSACYGVTGINAAQPYCAHVIYLFREREEGLQYTVTEVSTNT